MTYKLKLTSTGMFELTAQFINRHVAKRELDALNAPMYVKIRERGLTGFDHNNGDFYTYTLGYIKCEGKFYNNNKTLNVTGKKRLDWIIKNMDFDVVNPFQNSITLAGYLGQCAEAS